MAGRHLEPLHERRQQFGAERKTFVLVMKQFQHQPQLPFKHTHIVVYVIFRHEAIIRKQNIGGDGAIGYGDFVSAHRLSASSEFEATVTEAKGRARPAVMIEHVGHWKHDLRGWHIPTELACEGSA